MGGGWARGPSGPCGGQLPRRRVLGRPSLPALLCRATRYRKAHTGRSVRRHSHQHSGPKGRLRSENTSLPGQTPPTEPREPPGNLGPAAKAARDTHPAGIPTGIRPPEGRERARRREGARTSTHRDLGPACEVQRLFSLSVSIPVHSFLGRTSAQFSCWIHFRLLDFCVLLSRKLSSPSSSRLVHRCLGAGGGQSGELPTLDFGSGRDLRALC